MRCPQCKERFPANWMLNCSPGGQEAPGTFLFLAFMIVGVGAVLQCLEIWGWPSICYAFAFFVLTQVGVAWGDCRGAGCPKCQCKVRVWPWSM